MPSSAEPEPRGLIGRDHGTFNFLAGLTPEEKNLPVIGGFMSLVIEGYRSWMGRALRVLLIQLLFMYFYCFSKRRQALVPPKP